VSERDPALEPYVDLSNLGAHYNEIGKTKVDIRQRVYDCVEPGFPTPDYDLEVIQALQYAGIKDTDTIVDIGCSYPRFLELWQLAGHRGPLKGIDPNTAQFNDLSYMSLSPEQQDRQRLQRARKPGRVLPGIELYEATADKIPLENNSADAITAMFSASHWNQEKLLDALDEVIRIGKPAFMFAVALSGHDNKLMMHRAQEHIAKFCSDVIEEEVVPPPPLHAGLTSERAEAILPRKFENVYKKMFAYTICIDKPGSKEILLNAHRTQFDLYKTTDGEIIRQSLLEAGLQLLVGETIDRKLADGQAYTDTCLRAVILASPQPIRLGPDYQVISGRAA